MPSIVTEQDFHVALRTLGLAGVPVCIHAAFRSFGTVAGSTASLIAAFLEAHCTLLVPTFSWTFAIPPPPEQRFPCSRRADSNDHRRQSMWQLLSARATLERATAAIRANPAITQSDDQRITQLRTVFERLIRLMG
jgi:hypothetical protein